MHTFCLMCFSGFQIPDHEQLSHAWALQHTQ